MRCDLISHGDDGLSMRLAEVFGGITELRSELASLFGVDPEELKRFRRELNRIEAEAYRIRLESLLRDDGH